MPYLFEPETSKLWIWLFLAGSLTVFFLFLMIKNGRRKKASDKKNAALIFLLSGMFMLIGLTITLFMGYNIVQTKTLHIDAENLTLGAKNIPLSKIRRTFIHREGSGIPFSGLGAKKGTDNSLVIEYNEGESIIFSEDFYPLEEIVSAIQTLKKAKK